MLFEDARQQLEGNALFGLGHGERREETKYVALGAVDQEAKVATLIYVRGAGDRQLDTDHISLSPDLFNLGMIGD